jgi:glycosyltransferase involved in cell wall biosynthesis
MENKAPKVSVLIPSYNYVKYLQEAIDSVLAQSYTDYELIVVDNCSTDNTIEIVNRYIHKDSRVKLHINETNIGMYPNYNQALLLASGKYIKFLNADDKFHPNILEKFVDILETNPHLALVTSARQNFGSDDTVHRSKFIGLQKAEDIILEALDKGNFIGEPTTVMFRRTNLTLGLFDTSLLMFADYDMWLRQLSKGDIYFCEEVLSYFRQHDTQGTKTLGADIDKRTFNHIQLESYRRHAIISNRFTHDLMQLEPKKIAKILKEKHTKIHKFLFTKTTHKARLRLLLICLNPIAYLRYMFRKKV